MNRNALYVLGCYIFWGILPVYWKTLKCLDSFFILASRMVMSLIFVGLIIVLTKETKEVRKAFANRRELLLSCAAGVLVTINWGAYIYAVNSGHVLDASLAYYLNPILSIAVSAILFRERISARKWIAVSVAAVGIAYMIIQYRQIPYLALVIGGSFAFYGAAKKNVHFKPEVSIFIETLVVSPIGLVFMICMEAAGRGLSGNIGGAYWISYLMVGVVTAVPLLLYAKGVTHIPYSLTGILMFVNPTLQMLLGVFLFKEKLTTANIIMFICVWIAVILFVYDSRKAADRETQTEI